MQVEGKHYRTIWLKPDNEEVVQIIDQRSLPHRFVIEDLNTLSEAAAAIKDMHVRGAGLIGAAAGYGMYLAALSAAKINRTLQEAAMLLTATRPTAVNLKWAVDRQLRAAAQGSSAVEIAGILKKEAQAIADEDAACCRSIGQHGLKLIRELSLAKRGETVNILTHCNAGWLAFVDYGSATAPIYAAHADGIKVHVWVDETRPRSQGAKLTAWELLQQGVPHTVIADNTGGHLMQHALVDMVIVGTDRTTRTGDVANKIGTYLKALAAVDNKVPFYVALPSSTFDWEMRDGIAEVPIEERGMEEVRFVDGLCDGKIREVLVPPEGSRCANYGFDVTPARLISGLISERGLCQANEQSILELYPEHKA